MQYFLKLFIAISLFLIPSFIFSAELSTVSLAAPGAILINATTGKVLYEKNAHIPIYPASTTKIATALYVLKEWRPSLEEKVTIKPEALVSITPAAKQQSNYRSPAHWLETDGSHMGIKKGEEIPLLDLLYGMLLTSGNDAANAIAQHCGTTIPQFMQQLNLFLKKIHCKKSHFLNPHGLHHPQHLSTPYEMAMIAYEAMKDPLFRKIVSTKSYICPETNFEYERKLLQTNLLLSDGPYAYPPTIGIKTGTTTAAGKNLIAAAEKDGRCLIAAVFGSKKKGERYEDVISLFETAFAEPLKTRLLLLPGEQKIKKKIPYGKQKLKTYLPKGLAYTFYPSEEEPIKVCLSWTLPPLPISQHTPVAILRIKDSEGKCIQEESLFAYNDVTLNFIGTLQQKKNTIFLSLATILPLCLFVKIFLKKRKVRPRT